MSSLMILILIAVWAWYNVIRIKRNVHMLQLNAYRTERFARWMKANPEKAMYPRDVWPALALVFLLPIWGFSSAWAISLALLWAIGAYSLLIVTRPKPVEKKKLVYTSRVKRLLVTIGVLYVLILVIAWLVGAGALVGFLLLLVAANGLTFFIVMIANIINKPIESQINQHFFNDAENIVQSMPDLEVIGITGSFGKTSTKHILKAVLASQYNVLMTPESYNTKMGVTRTIREQLKPYHDLFIVEMGAKQTHDIQEICDLVHQKYGVLTAIGEQHLETFKTLENIKKTKFEIVETLPEDGTAILNKDDENIRAYQQMNNCRTMYYGIDADELHYRATDIAYSAKGTTFNVQKYDGTSVTMETKLLGRHNIYNILAAVAIGSEKNIPLEKIARAIKGVPPVPHRLELKKSSANLTIIDDSFNSNPTGSKMAVEVLGSMPEKKVLITPGMIELGEKEYELNKTLAHHAAGVCDFIILVGKKQTEPLQDGLTEVEYPQAQSYVAADLQDALQKMHEVTATELSVVLLENDLPDTFNE